MNKNSTLIIVVNVVLAIFGIAILFFASIFSLGSQEDYLELINKSHWSYFSNRLLFNILVSIVVILIIGFFNYLIFKINKQKVKIKKILLLDFLVFLVCSMFFIACRLNAKIDHCY
jgi:uncharacterized membrane protein